jgi:hypothetical protein
MGAMTIAAAIGAASRHGTIAASHDRRIPVPRRPDAFNNPSSTLPRGRPEVAMSIVDVG